MRIFSTESGESFTGFDQNFQWAGKAIIALVDAGEAEFYTLDERSAVVSLERYLNSDDFYANSAKIVGIFERSEHG